MANIFELFGKIVVDSGDAQREINETSNKAKAFATAMKKGITDAAKWGAGIATAAAAATVAITNEIKKIVSSAAEHADTIDKMSQNMGLSAQAYQEWEHALQHCGLEMEKLHGGMDPLRKLFQSANDGTKEAIEAFDDLGFSAFSLEGDLLNDEQALERVIYALADMEDIARRNEIADMAFGGAYEEMLPLLNLGSEGIKALREEAHALGLVMSGEDVAAGVKYTDTIYDLSASFQSLKNDLGMMIIPHLTELAEKLLAKIPDIKAKLAEWEEPISNTLDKLVSGLEWVIDNPEEVGKALETIGVGFVALMGFIKPVETAIVLIGAGIIGLAKTFGGGNTETEKFEKTMSDLDETFVQTMQDIEDEYTEANTLLETIEQLGEKTNKTALETIMWKQAVDRMEEILPGFKKHINEETGEIIGGTEAIYDRIEAMKAEAEAKAAAEYLQGKQKAVAEAYGKTGEMQLDIGTNIALLPSREAAYLEAKAAYEAYDKAHPWKPIGSEARKESERLLKDYQQKFATYNTTLHDIESTKKDLENLQREVKKAEEELSAAEKAINGGAEGIQQILTSAEKALEGTGETLKVAAGDIGNAVQALKETEVTPDLAANAQKVLQEDLNDMNLTAQVTPVLSGRGYTFSGKSGASRNGGSYAFADSVFSNWLGRLPGHASGLDKVPYDNYIARLHKGETVLTANEASAYRSGEGNARVEAAVNRLGEIMIQVLSAIKEGQVMQLDTGVLVGATAGAMNDRLGTIATRNGRRN